MTTPSLAALTLLVFVDQFAPAPRLSAEAISAEALPPAARALASLHAHDLLPMADARFQFDPAATIDVQLVTGLATLGPAGNPPPSAASSVRMAAFEPLQEDAAAPALREFAGTADNPFGRADSLRWTLTAAYADDFEDDAFYRLGGGVSYFLVDDFSIDFEAHGLFLDQDEENEFGLSLNMLLRWHFLHDEARTWSLYVDGGVGLMWATDDTPEGGSDFNFTPQLGIGASFDLDGAGGNDVHLLTGVRWHHISNAQTESINPGQDEMMLYATLNFPF